jgi:uncharacterized protein
MFREMRRNEKQLSEEETIEVLKSAEEGVLATIGDNDYPYAVPLNYTYDSGSIYFHCAVSGQKTDNMEHNSRVSFCVVTDTEILPAKFATNYKSVIVFGRAVELFDDDMKVGLRALINRFSSDHVEAGEKYINAAIHKTRVFKLDIEHMTGKATQ